MIVSAYSGLMYHTPVCQIISECERVWQGEPAEFSKCRIYNVKAVLFHILFNCMHGLMDQLNFLATYEQPQREYKVYAS